MKVWTERAPTDAERAQFARDVADTTPYLDLVAVGSYVTVKHGPRRGKKSRAQRRAAAKETK